MFALVTVLALLFLGAAKADYRLKWRHAPAGDSKRFIAGCDAQGQSGVGAPYSLVTNYHGCYKDFRGGQTVTDKLGPIYWGGFYHYLARCMDAGEEAALGARPTVQDCVDKKQSQQWVIHSNGQVELGCSGFCLDIMDGGNQIQLWDCVAGNKNQEFDVVQVGGSG
ncbi:carbohydrate-binding module family 13 protein/putative endo-1,3-beta-glucanase [Trichosporon asahii var. asahii CBS 2479]|uniref:Carbohydrate-binding module family 13 protein/putative endo-1,3-beta-glucanase n=1 Tax=Trichosporon asahii var. asahii (strain ATCC 90039 / CBS 2479 / JCM 2466 / KCTC 7840 / NBRC 103889/ NCYC 2677 / UAMH 7654) TaxID=1186058 RepID=J5SSV0_TRIAS|nr:carbohydrate-binding module family 13 protein/putative endo-1,3-beta-glucanase [Trichosporon asahii var. asahii CBS 2479]EJT47356.1 carbohydrate-binding module family 13 protein/putative endo-1,3-beta-glucanase [Trichosporon asahii var. asahii CBS 2479]